MQLVTNNQQVNIKNLNGNADVVINVTLEKDLINNKTKNVSRSNSIVINKTSRVGVATDGLQHQVPYMEEELTIKKFLLIHLMYTT